MRAGLARALGQLVGGYGETIVPHIDAALEALKNGPRGALFVSAVSASILLLIWLAFYFLLFLPRGSIG